MKQIQYLVIMMVLCIAAVSCYKDKGNYNYHPINELSFLNFDTTNGYSVEFGQPLTVSPQIKGTLDTSGAQKSYSYEWSLYFNSKDSVISTDKILNVKLQEPPGNYTLQLIVTDKTTGVQYAIRTQLLIITEIFEGFLVLNEVSGKSRLDMITYNRTDNTYKQHTDILTEMGSQLPVQGKPIQVFCMESEYFAKTPDSYLIYLVTETGTYRLNPETFGYIDQYNFRNEITGQIPADFMPLNLSGGIQYGITPMMFLSEGANIYKRGFEYPTFPYVPINIYAGAATPFKAFPIVPMYYLYATIYNMDKRTFTSFSLSGVNVTDMAPASGFPVGRDMVYMEGKLNGNAYAVMKDPGTTTYYMVRFSPFMKLVSYNEQITGTDIDKAEHFAVSPDLGYLFYSVGGKVYEYDPFLKTSFLMLDKGSARITYLSFQSFFASASFTKYADWSKLLNVGTYDPSGAEGSNGTLEQYSVPPINAALTRTNVWTGLGKITSVTYRERN